MQTVDQQAGRNRGERQVVGRRPGTHTHMSIVTCVTCKTTHDLMGLASLSSVPAQLQLQFHSMCSRHLNWCNSSSGSSRRCTCKWDYCGRGAGESGQQWVCALWIVWQLAEETNLKLVRPHKETQYPKKSWHMHRNILINANGENERETQKNWESQQWQSKYFIWFSNYEDKLMQT